MENPRSLLTSLGLTAAAFVAVIGAAIYRRRRQRRAREQAQTRSDTRA